MVIEFKLGLVAGSLSSLKPLPFFRRFGSSTNSNYTESTDNESHELGKVNADEIRRSRKKGGLGTGTTILEESVNESQERMIFPKPI